MRKQIINTVITRAGSTLLNFLLALMIARHSGPEVKGQTTLIITTIFFIVFICNILGGHVLVYLLPRNKIEALLLPALVWSLLVSISAYAFLSLTSIIPAEWVVAVSALAWLSAIISTQQTVLLAQQNIRLSNMLSLVPLVFLVSGVGACYLFFNVHNVHAYIYASIFSYTITAGLGFALLARHINISSIHFSLADIRSNFSYGFVFQLVEILQLLNLRLYFYQLGLQQGPRYLGIYSIGISILEAVWIIPRSIATVHYVSTSNTVEVKHEAERTLSLVKFSLIACALALLVLYLVPNSVYVFVFGHGFTDVKHSVRFLFPGIWIYSVLLVISSFYYGVARYKALLVANAAGLITLIIFSALLIPHYVMSGAGLAATISYSVAALSLLFFFIADNKLSVTRFFPNKNDIKFFNTFIKTSFIKK
ncbi:MAG: hypothetical protein U0V74_16730 [Chitinophagales bacterium]